MISDLKEYRHRHSIGLISDKDYIEFLEEHVKETVKFLDFLGSISIAIDEVVYIIDKAKRRI